MMGSGLTNLTDFRDSTQDQWKRAELAAKRIKDKAKHRKGDRAEKHAITFFAKDYR